MASQASLRRKSGKSARRPSEEVEPIEELIRRLVCLLDRQNAALEAGNDFIPEEIMLDRTVDAVRYLLIRMPLVAPGHAPLSPREHEIVRMVAEGHPTKVIAGVLNISCWTVTAHLRRIFLKLGVTSRPAMVARLLEEGRSRNMRVPAEQSLFASKAFVDTPTDRGTDETQ